VECISQRYFPAGFHYTVAQGENNTMDRAGTLKVVNRPQEGLVIHLCDASVKDIFL